MISAKISGDGEAIALVELHGSRRDAASWTAAGGRAHDDGAPADEVNNDDDADAYGVHTFERDVDDGSGPSERPPSYRQGLSSSRIQLPWPDLALLEYYSSLVLSWCTRLL